MNMQSLSKLSDSDLATTVTRLATRTNETSSEVWLIVGKMRLFGRKIDDLIESVKNRVRNRTDISVLYFGDRSRSVFDLSDRTKHWPQNGRGRRKFFTTADVQKVDRIAAKSGWSVYNGCTTFWLRDVYRCDIFHEMGRGWFWYPDKPTKSN